LVAPLREARRATLGEAASPEPTVEAASLVPTGEAQPAGPPLVAVPAALEPAADAVPTASALPGAAASVALLDVAAAPRVANPPAADSVSADAGAAVGVAQPDGPAPSVAELAATALRRPAEAQTAVPMAGAAPGQMLVAPASGRSEAPEAVREAQLPARVERTSVRTQQLALEDQMPARAELLALAREPPVAELAARPARERAAMPARQRSAERQLPLRRNLRRSTPLGLRR
jgi:hypothetical protein